VSDDLRQFQRELEHVPRGANVVQRSAHHLLDLGGKHLRPMCVALASKVNGTFDDRARKLALAVELVHSATLLHDDVVDVGATRRGSPAARSIYGNAASIFAGDWLLIEALRQIRRADVPGLLDRMLEIIEEMILAESIQLENRGRINASTNDYFSVVEGKTAALFRWGMLAGGRAGGLDDERCQALETYGLHLGVAFQAVDDLLDIDGDSLVTGKALFTDVREGKMTYPLIVALERAPSLMPLLEECAGLDADKQLPPSALRELVSTVADTGALEDCRTLAETRARRAIEALDLLGNCPGRTALVTVAEASVYRES
jgi:octaprenyl-diphosphate synthase